MAAGDIIVVNEDGSGKKGNYFDGTDDYVLHDAHAVARVAANDTVGTYTAWIYLNDLAGSYTVLSAGDNNSVNEFFTLASIAGVLRVFFVQGGATQFNVIETTGSLPARTWTHVALRHNGTRPDLFVNGEIVAMTDTTATDLTMWYDELANVDKFAIGIKESNATHTQDFNGAIGQVKYFALDLTAAEIKKEYKDQAHVAADSDAVRVAAIATALVFNITMEDDGTTDSGTGADNGTLTGNAYYGGLVSDWSYTINANVTGHAAEFMNTILDGNKFRTIIKRGD